MTYFFWHVRSNHLNNVAFVRRVRFLLQNLRHPSLALSQMSSNSGIEKKQSNNVSAVYFCMIVRNIIRSITPSKLVYFFHLKFENLAKAFLFLISRSEMRAILNLVRCRHLRRPSFDIVTSFARILRLPRAILVKTCIRQDSDNLSNHRIFPTSVSSVKFFDNEKNPYIRSEKMALNKLSIDKVDLAGKRVLIR